MTMRPKSVMVADDTAARWTSDRQGVSTGQRSQTPEAVRQGPREVLNEPWR